MSEGESIDSIKTYLLVRKHPDASRIRLSSSLSVGSKFSGRQAEYLVRKQGEIIAYQKLLAGKSPDELMELYQQERAKQRLEAEMEAEKRENEAFFNQSSAIANAKVYEHYAKLATWTLDEAVVLMLGRNPRIVSWNLVIETTKGILQVFPFVERFRDLREMAQRAAEVKQLYDPVLPSSFLAWARRKEINLPQELLDNVEKFCSPIGDWQEAHGKLKEQFDILLKDRDKIVDIANRLIEERNGLKEKVAQLEANAGSQQPDKPRYSTPLLAIMEKAIAEFFDPRRNPDAKKEEVVEWLKEQMAAEKMNNSDNMATAIFTIIKPPDHDPRKRRG